jgi:hypothetical protein
VVEELGKKELLPGMLVTGWDIRTIDDLFTTPVESLNAREQKILKTIPLIAERMKAYFA